MRRDALAATADDGELALPIMVGGDRYATLVVTGSAEGRFSREDEWLATALAASAGVALGNAMARADSDRRRRWQRALAEAAAAIRADGSEALETIARQAALAAPAEFACIGSVSGDLMVVDASWGASATPPFGTTLTLDDDVLMWAPLPVTAASAGGLPSVPRALAVQRDVHADPYDQDDADQLIMFAQHLASAL